MLNYAVPVPYLIFIAYNFFILSVQKCFFSLSFFVRAAVYIEDLDDGKAFLGLSPLRHRTTKSFILKMPPKVKICRKYKQKRKL
jgi:hypothetical protein